MGYPKRSTLGYCECRPKEFQSDVFLRPKLKCSSKCLYHIFCMTEIKKTSLGDRIKQLRLSLQKPYHVFSAMENGEIYLLFENDEGERISFREKTLIGAVQKAEDYLVASKIRTGQEQKLEEKNPNPATPEVPISSEPKPEPHEDDGIKTESYGRNDKGEKFPDSD